MRGRKAGPVAVAVMLVVGLAVPRQTAAQTPPPHRPIEIGVEYALDGTARALAGLGIPAVKFLPDNYTWQKMQPRPGAPVDFRHLDALVREYQDAGFREVVLALETISDWAIPGRLRDRTPKPEHREAFKQWVRAMVERYDGDGRADMPGLRAPIRYLEVGVEFSSYQPGPVANYLAMLKDAYDAAKQVSPNVQVAHAAFLLTGIFDTRPGPAEYEAAFARMSKRVLNHGLQGMRQILDRPDRFDLANFHALGSPYEIPETVKWLRWEMRRRGYDKPIIIADTTPAFLIAWGPADTCKGGANQLGLIVAPAREEDRCRLAEVFQGVLGGNRAALDWMHGFIADDMAKKIVLAAASGVVLIDTAFSEDLHWQKIPAFRAGAGTSAWAGMLEVEIKAGKRVATGAKRPLYHAVRQVQAHLGRYGAIHRLPGPADNVHVYQVDRPDGPLWIAWAEAPRLLLPGDPAPAPIAYALPAGGPVTVEPLIVEAGASEPRHIREPGPQVMLSPRPIFVRRTN